MGAVNARLTTYDRIFWPYVLACGLRSRNGSRRDAGSSRRRLWAVPGVLVGRSELTGRRLRLQDSTGKDIEDVQRYFKHKDIVVLYAGSESGSREWTPSSMLTPCLPFMSHRRSGLDYLLCVKGTAIGCI